MGTCLCDLEGPSGGLIVNTNPKKVEKWAQVIADPAKHELQGRRIDTQVRAIWYPAAVPERVRLHSFCIMPEEPDRTETGLLIPKIEVQQGGTFADIWLLLGLMDLERCDGCEELVVAALGTPVANDLVRTREELHALPTDPKYHGNPLAKRHAVFYPTLFKNRLALLCEGFPSGFPVYTQVLYTTPA